MIEKVIIFLCGGVFFQLVRVVIVILKTDMVLVVRDTIYADPVFHLFHQGCGGDATLDKIGEGIISCKQCGCGVALGFDGGRFAGAVIKTVKDKKKRRVVKYWRGCCSVDGKFPRHFSNFVFRKE